MLSSKRPFKILNGFARAAPFEAVELSQSRLDIPSAKLVLDTTAGREVCKPPQHAMGKYFLTDE
jgi:hypothetical protein